MRTDEGCAFITVIDEVGSIPPLDVPTQSVVRRVRSLEQLDLADLTGVRAVIYSSKGGASHAEVVCRIKGIALVHEQEGRSTPEPASVITRREIPIASASALAGFAGRFQISAFEPEDVIRIDPDLIGNIFVRVEHLLYRAVAADPEVLEDTQRLSGALRVMIADLLAVTPPTGYLLLRGADVRSDDPMLGEHFHGRREPNPEMGVHGVRWLLAHPEWVELEADLAGAFDSRVKYAVPFVARRDDFEQFVEQHGRQFTDLIPFLESPAAAWMIAPDWPSACIGLKDLSQFFFAADRANPDTSEWVDFAHPDLVSYIAETVCRARSAGTHMSLYQDPSIFASYSQALGNTGWTPSFSAGELGVLSRAMRQSECS